MSFCVAQVVPQMCRADISQDKSPVERPPPICVQAECILDFATGWADWAAAAGLCGWLQFYEGTSNLSSLDLDAWQSVSSLGFQGANCLYCFAQGCEVKSVRTFLRKSRSPLYARIVSSKIDPLQSLFIRAPCWERQPKC